MDKVEVEVEEEEVLQAQEEDEVVIRGMLNAITTTSMGSMRGSVEQNKL